MGYFEINFLKKYFKGKFSAIDTIVETGTFLGNDTSLMAKHFKNVITIELNKSILENTKKRLAAEGYNNIEYLNGDSGEIIKFVVAKLKKPAVFFLDAHWSGDETVDWQNSSWKGYGVSTSHIGKDLRPNSCEQVPLGKEIKAIAKEFECHGIIYIDDFDNFDRRGRGLKNVHFIGEDWSSLNLKAFKKEIGFRLRDWIQINDQLLIIFNEKRSEQDFGLLNKLCFFSLIKPKIALRQVLWYTKKTFKYLTRKTKITNYY